MATPTTLLGSLTARFEADATLASLVPSGVWVSQVPEGTPLPFVVILHGGEVPEWYTERDYVEQGTVQFLCYAKGCAAAEAVATAVKDAFDWQPLTITGHNAASIEVRRTNYTVSATDMHRAADGEIVYEAAVEYQTLIRKTY
jgi:hypothetical protein